MQLWLRMHLEEVKHLEGGLLARHPSGSLALCERQQQSAQERLRLEQHPPTQRHVQRQRNLRMHAASIQVPFPKLKDQSTTTECRVQRLGPP